MTEDEAKLETMSGILLAHTALLTGLVLSLRNERALAQDEVNALVDRALIGVENDPHSTPEAARVARQYLEMLAGNFAGPREIG